jgi:hypothetical protein
MKLSIKKYQIKKFGKAKKNKQIKNNDKNW